jgi:RND family efflux transporter MFP subunit
MTQATLARWTIRLCLLSGAVVIGLGAFFFVASESNKAAAESTQAAAAQNVDTIRPKRADISRRFDTNATFEAYETADLYPKVSGYLSEVRGDIGDHVKAGQVLALVSIPEMDKELAEAEAQLAAKRADAALQQVTLQRQEMLLSGRGATQQAYDEAKSKSAVAAAQVDLAAATVAKIRTMLGYTRVVAPFDGVMSRRNVNRGDFVQAATAGRTNPLFTVQRIDVIRVFCQVPESDVSHLKAGLRATVKPYGLEGKSFEGTVTRFARELDPQTRNMRTEIDLPNPNELLYPGMYAQVSLETERHQNVLTLPATSVASDRNGKFVSVVQQGRIVHQPISTGMAESSTIEVLDGLADTTDVVMVAQGAPPPGTLVKVVSHDMSTNVTSR